MIRLFLTVLFSLGFAVGSVFRVEVAQTEDNGIGKTFNYILEPKKLAGIAVQINIQLR